MARKLVVCCDGTGNEIQGNQSNVLKFYRLLEKRPHKTNQIAYYDPGVGTISESGGWSRWRSEAKGVFGLVTGAGLDRNVLEAYKFLVRHYERGDRIYLFGFSRGAYTIRILAGVVALIGILERNQEHLCEYALNYYKRVGRSGDPRVAYGFNEVIPTHRARIKFMGCWDTVGSVIVPRFDRPLMPLSFETPPLVRRNSAVEVFRHALAIDEHRSMFRVAEWEEGQKFKPRPFLADSHSSVVDQDVKQVWFSGVHSDVGGGYSEAESTAAKIPLRWMVDEAREHGLEFRETLYRMLVLGRNRKGTSRPYSKPDVNGKLHHSLRGAWRWLEWVPKFDKYKEWPERRSVLGMYLPRGEPRHIPDGAVVHLSATRRKFREPGGEPYRPVNWPKWYVSS
ncbi:MAG: DUF2235 domain-containing protein [Pseudomonadota bacterium]